MFSDVLCRSALNQGKKKDVEGKLVLLFKTFTA